MARRVARWRGALAAENLGAGERVAVMLPNGVDWVCLDQAALSLGLVVVSLYPTDNPEDAGYILADSGARLLVTEVPQWQRLQPHAAPLTQLARVVCVDSDAAPPGGLLHGLEPWLGAARPEPPAAPADPRDLTTIIYTSGTTGRPKGVVLSHRNIIANIEAVLQGIAGYREDVFLSFLPLSHALERTVGYYLPIATGGAVVFARSIQTLAEDLLAVQPSMLVSVPRLYERVYARLQQLESGGVPARALFEWAESVGWRRFEAAQHRGVVAAPDNDGHGSSAGRPLVARPRPGFVLEPSPSLPTESTLARDASPLTRLPTGVWVLGFVSLLMDISSEMIHSLLPLFMVGTLGASAVAVGLIEGLAESTALVVKVFSGALSDYLGKRKGLAVFGYALGALTKPLFAVAPTTGVVLAARLLDRVGKGVRGAPRDALVADLAPAAVRGAAFGLRQSLDTVGAVLGPLLAVGLMLWWANDFRAVFWVAVIPGLLAVALLQWGVDEPARHVGEKRTNPIRRENLRRLGGAYWWVVAVGAVFTLARFSEAFLVLRAEQSGIAVALVPLVMVAMNVVYAASAYPFGQLSDRMNHKVLLALGLLVLIAADVVLALGGHWTTVLAGVALWGIHMGMTQGLLATMVADTAPAELRGTAFGVFNLVSGFAMLVASVVAGLLWDRLGASFTFYAGAAFSALALLGLLKKP